MIPESVAVSTVPSTKVVTHVQDVHIERMEKALSIWIEDNVQKNMPLGGPLIRARAMRMYAHLAGAGEASSSDAGMSDAGMSSHSPFQAIRGGLTTLRSAMVTATLN